MGLAVFAGVIAFGMSNLSGAMTVLFMALLSFVGVYTFNKKLKSAKAEKNAFVDRVDLPNADMHDIARLLEEFGRSRSTIVQRKNAFENAKFRLSAAEDNFESDLNRIRALAEKFGIDYIESEGEQEMSALVQKIKNYLLQRHELEAKIRENVAISRSLKLELERFNESDIRARITPEIEEKS